VNVRDSVRNILSVLTVLGLFSVMNATRSTRRDIIMSFYDSVSVSRPNMGDVEDADMVVDMDMVAIDTGLGRGPVVNRVRAESGLVWHMVRRGEGGNSTMSCESETRSGCHCWHLAQDSRKTDTSRRSAVILDQNGPMHDQIHTYTIV
jgi:hypothetical protein